MFKLFGKKKDAQTSEPPVQSEETVQISAGKSPALAAAFLPEEFTILAVTGPDGFASVQNNDLPGRTAVITLTAWVEEGGDQVHRERTPLLALTDDRLLSYLRGHVPRDFIIKVRVRAGVDGTRFLMAGLPQPGFDPELKAILDEQKTPKQVKDEELGVFTLNRTMGCFQAEVDWLEEPVFLSFLGEENAQGCLAAARALVSDAPRWDDQVRAFAVRTLSEGEEDFSQRLALDSILVQENGGFEFWFSDGEMEWEFSVCVSGTLTGGVDNARKEV